MDYQILTTLSALNSYCSQTLFIREWFFLCRFDSFLVLLSFKMLLDCFVGDEVTSAMETVVLPKSWQVFVDFLVHQLLRVNWQHIFKDYLVKCSSDSSSFLGFTMLLILGFYDLSCIPSHCLSRLILLLLVNKYSQ